MVSGGTSETGQRSSLPEILAARPSVTLLVAGGALLALGSAFIGLANAVLTAQSVRASNDLVDAGLWVSFVGVAAALAAISVAGWTRLPRHGWTGAIEIAAAATATLLFAIGQLVHAANAPNDSNSASVVAAVGLGGWMAILLYNAARRSIAEQAGARPHQSYLWLLGTAGALILAVGVGLPAPSYNDAALAISTSVLYLVGYALLASALDMAHRRRHIADHRLDLVLAGLIGLVLGHLGLAISSGFVYGSSSDLTTVRVGLSIPNFVDAVAWAILAYAAFRRLSDLILASPGPHRDRRGWYSSGVRGPVPPPAPAPGSPPEAGPESPPFPGPIGFPAAATSAPWTPAPVPPPPPPPAAEPPGAADPTETFAAADPTETVAAADPTAADLVAADITAEPEPDRPARAVHCGEPLPDGASFCPRCGAAIVAPN